MSKLGVKFMLRSQTNWNFTYNQLNIHSEEQASTSLTEKLLLQRGIIGEEATEFFLNPKLTDLYDPSLIKDMDKAVERVKLAIRNEEKILVFGDYDADGVSSTSVMLEALNEIDANCDFYIPNRFTEGYGPNEAAFREAKEAGFKLIITVDTGVAAIKEALVAKELGIDLIITDHHEVQEKLPDAFAIVHPKCSPDYQFQELAGVGVAFKFAQALLGYFPEHLLDLVVIGTIADLVPLVSENRIFAYHGLRAISNSKRPGIQALKQVCKIEDEVTEENIGFMIGPRINAVGRLQDATPAVHLLLTDDAEEAGELAEFIQQLNSERQKIVSEIAKEAEEMAELDETGANESVIVVAKEGWNEGVLGIVASKLVRKYDRPAIVLSINREKGEAKGSARSIDAFDLFSNCMQIRDTFIHFGGHAQAAGMSLFETNITSLRMKLNEIASEKLSDEDFKQVITIDSTINIEELNLNIVKEIRRLAPFGMDNPKPIFHIKDIPSEIRQIGSQQNHLKMKLQRGKATLDGIGFGLGDLYYQIAPQSCLEAVGELDINEWNGKKKLQLLIRDIAVSEWQLFDYRGTKHLQKKVHLSPNESSLAIHFQPDTNNDWLPQDIQDISFNRKQIEENGLSEVNNLILTDLPSDLADLSRLLITIKPERVFACYRLEGGQFLNAFPSRDDFKWFYAMMMKKEQVNIEKEMNMLASYKGWSFQKIEFISQVFFELEFVKIDNGVIRLNSNPAKRDLNESALYQQKLRSLEIETTLYYSNFRELKEWFDKEMQMVMQHREEVINGL